MRCPDCRRPVDPRAPRCQACGVELLEAFERRAFEAQLEGAAARHRRRPASRRRAKARRALAGAVAAGLCALAFAALAVSRVRPPLAAGARVARGCAFEAPPGFSERAPVSGSWTGLARWEDSVSVIDVLYAPPGLAERAQSDAGAALAASTAFDGTRPRVEASRAVRVDGVDGVRLSVSGERAYLPSAQAGLARAGSLPAPRYESQPVRGELVLLPASGATLVIRGVSSEGSAPDLDRALDAFCARFRVLARPS